MMSSLQSTSSLEDLLNVVKIIHRRQMYDSGCFFHFDMSQLLLLGKFEYGGGLIFKVVLEY